MAVKIGSNISSLQAQSRLTGTAASLDQVFERLSSGQRINRASDDAAGLSISSSLDLSARVFSVSKRNVSDVISALSIADSATEALQSITTRQRELATQASSGTFSSKQREALDAEARELTNEYNRVILTTEFNGRKLFEDPFEIMTAQVGIGEGGTIGYELASELATPLEGGSYFVLDGARNTYVWFTMDGKGSDPRPFDGNGDEKRGIQVDLVSSPGGGTLNSSVNLRFSDGASFMRGANAETVGFALPSFSGSLWFNVDGTNTNSTSGYMGPGDYEVSISSGWSASQVRSAVVSALNTWQPGTFSLTLEGDSELIIKEANPDPSSFGYGASVSTYGTSVIASAIQGGTVAGPTRGEVAQAVVNAINNFVNGNHSASLGSSEGEVLIEATAAGGSGSTGDVSTGIVTSELLTAGKGLRMYGPYKSPAGDIKVVDVNNDGAPDVIQPKEYGSLGVSLNIGDGTFGATADYFSSAIANYSYDNVVTTADLNGDGFTDIVVGGYQSGHPSFVGNQQISVFLNRRDGTFDSEITLGLASTSRGPVALADVNNDGRVDILQANGSGTTSRVDLFLNQGNGSFSSAVTIDLPNSSSSGSAQGGVSLADLNGDGWNDLVAPISNYNRLAISLNTGTGLFGPMATYMVASGPAYSTSLTDLNGDGRPDIVQSHRSSTVSVLLNNGNGSFGSAVTYAIGDNNGQGARVQDINGDGRPDLIRASGTAISVSLNNGSGGFGAITNYSGITNGVTSVAISDVTGDGLADIVHGSQNSLNILQNIGGGLFGTVSSYSYPVNPFNFSRGFSPVVSDLNSDGLNDIVRSSEGLDVAFAVHTNQGAGSFASTALSARLTFSDARGTAKIQHVDLTTAASAREAMDTLETRAEQISRQRAVYGGVESRLKAAASVIDSTIINYRSAESRIKDTDVAEDAASMVRLNILKQVGASVLAQANLEPQIALRLLQGA